MLPFEVPSTIFLTPQVSFRGILGPSEPNDLFTTPPNSYSKCEVKSKVKFLAGNPFLFWKHDKIVFLHLHFYLHF